MLRAERPDVDRVVVTDYGTTVLRLVKDLHTRHHTVLEHDRFYTPGRKKIRMDKSVFWGN